MVFFIVPEIVDPTTSGDIEKLTNTKENISKVNGTYKEDKVEKVKEEKTLHQIEETEQEKQESKEKNHLQSDEIKEDNTNNQFSDEVKEMFHL